MDANDHAKVWRAASTSMIQQCHNEFGPLNQALGDKRKAWEHMASIIMLASHMADAYERAAAAQERNDG